MVDLTEIKRLYKEGFTIAVKPLIGRTSFDDKGSISLVVSPGEWELRQIDRDGQLDWEIFDSWSILSAEPAPPIYKGDIKHFPKEVVDKMLFYQDKQGNKRDVSVFEKDKTTVKAKGGFNWVDTEEGKPFWSQVIESSNFDLFFKSLSKRNAGYRPFTKEDRDELRSKWVIHQITKKEDMIIGFDFDNEAEWITTTSEYISPEQLFDNYTFLDGSICGNKVDSE